MRLGELIDALEKFSPDLEVRFDDDSKPDGFDSYRGIYAHLALSYDHTMGKVTVGEILKEAKECVGKTFRGYKGGEHTMTLDTPVWKAQYGRASMIGIFEAKEDDAVVYLKTGDVEAYFYA